jgi:DNA-binding response OmpR family regulator
MTAYIVVADDDPDVLSTVSRLLSREGYEVGKATVADEAWRLVNTRRPELLILDVVMPPGMNGLVLCRRLRADQRFADLPVLFLTAHGGVDEIVAGLDAGGDDYVPKPFELAELTARVRALLRRSQRDPTPVSVLEIGKLRLDSNTYRMVIDKDSIQLTATEHHLLRYMMEHVNQAIPSQRLLEEVWNYPPHSGDPDLVRAHIRNLRVKLQKYPDVREMIRTIHGVGYMVAD